MTSEFPVRRIVQINPTLSVEMTAGVGHFSCAWSRQPRRLSRKEQRRYREARNQLLQEVAQRSGLNILVVET
jgi:hypothetical protein